MDKRLFHRRTSAIDFRVYDTASNQLVGRLGDLSEGGFLIYGDQGLGHDKFYNLAIEYPDEAGQSVRAEFEVKTMWSGPDRNPDLQLTGLRIYHLEDPRVSAALNALMERFTVGGEDLED